MKQIVVILSLTFFLMLQNNAFAQRGDNHKERWEKFRTEKVAFLTNNLDLTPEEAQKFWPVYNQMEKEKGEFQKNRHELERKVRDEDNSLSDEEIIKLTRAYAETQKKEGELEVKYNEELLKILPPQKVLKLYQAEGEFRMYMFRKYRDKKGNDKHP